MNFSTNPATTKPQIPEPSHLVFQLAEKNKNFVPIKQEFKLDMVVREFWGRVYRKYFYKTTKTYGKFVIKSSDCFESFLEGYLKSDDIAKLANLSGNLFFDKIKSKSAATGGLLFFSDFNDNNTRHLFVILLKDTEGFKFEKNKLIEAPHLEINKIHFAALIDLDGWQNKTDNYLSFVRGATRSGEISEYFTDFIGCQVTSSSAVTSSNFTNGLMEFARTTYPHPNLKERLQFIDKIVNLIQVYKQQKKDIELEEFCNTLDSNQSHDIKNFLQNNYKVDSLFTFDSSAMKQLKYHTYKVRNVSISFPIGFDKYEVDINNKKLIIELEDLEFLKNLKR